MYLGIIRSMPTVSSYHPTQQFKQGKYNTKSKICVKII